MKNSLELSRDKKEEVIEEIKSFFNQERNENIGDLGAMLILDFFAEKLGPYYYNQGLYDAISFISEKTDDLFGLERPTV